MTYVHCLEHGRWRSSRHTVAIVASTPPRSGLSAFRREAGVILIYRSALIQPTGSTAPPHAT